jgi:hypothetical protein
MPSTLAIIVACATLSTCAIGESVEKMCNYAVKRAHNRVAESAAPHHADQNDLVQHLIEEDGASVTSSLLPQQPVFVSHQKLTRETRCAHHHNGIAHHVPAFEPRGPHAFF